MSVKEVGKGAGGPLEEDGAPDLEYEKSNSRELLLKEMEVGGTFCQLLVQYSVTAFARGTTNLSSMNLSSRTTANLSSVNTALATVFYIKMVPVMPTV